MSGDPTRDTGLKVPGETERIKLGSLDHPTPRTRHSVLQVLKQGLHSTTFVVFGKEEKLGKVLLNKRNLQQIFSWYFSDFQLGETFEMEFL